MKTVNRLAVFFILFAFSFYAHAGEDGIIRILAIGNSFSRDAIESNFYQMAKASGVKTIVGNMYIGGCTLERHYNNAKNNTADYAYRKITVDGIKTNTKGVNLETALKDEPWDYISLQQGSPLSGLYDTYMPYLPFLISYIKSLAPKGVKLVWHQTWAYAADCPHPGFAKYERDQMTMYNAIMRAAQQTVIDYGFDIVVPSGTAIQNARTTFIGDRMNRDGQHLHPYYGRYCAACVWLEAVLGVNPIGNKYSPPKICECYRKAVQTAAHEACQNPYAVTDLSHIKPCERCNAHGTCPDNAVGAITNSHR